MKKIITTLMFTLINKFAKCSYVYEEKRVRRRNLIYLKRFLHPISAKMTRIKRNKRFTRANAHA